MKKMFLFLILLWGGGALGYWYVNESHGPKLAFRAVEVSRGDLLATINATGTIEPEMPVDVCAQIAGEVQSFGDDPRDPGKPIGFGSPVEKGTVLARLDDSLFQARVNQAHAGVTRAEAEVEQARVKVDQTHRELERMRDLRRRPAGTVSGHDFDEAVAAHESAKAGHAVARAAVAVAKADLDLATVNLGYTIICSPVKGVILDRRVNLGQTVVASLNAFLIAKDLKQLEIWATVNETDVGAIHEGQSVRFTVGAFPADSFRGQVAQIRLNASMNSGVVSYTVVVEVDNTSGKLLPYLTARLQFEVDERRDVWLVPNAALRWRPKPAMVVPEAREAFAHPPERKPDGAKPKASEATKGTLWIKQGDFVRSLEVSVGLSDGVKTEVSGDALAAGLGVVVGQSQVEANEASGHPFVPNVQRAKSDKDSAKKSP